MQSPFGTPTGSIAETIRGIVDRVTYHNPDNGWSVLRVFPFNSPSQQETVIVHQTGLSKGFSACAKDLSEAVASMRLKGLCEKLPEHVRSLDDKQRSDILDDLLKLRDEESNQE